MVIEEPVQLVEQLGDKGGFGPTIPAMRAPIA